ncbi:hypothetical protein PI87_21850 [Ralstonia sp. A12]|nr:hypothetical protein PI87_21850 [Ralstonia sp. A12]
MTVTSVSVMCATWLATAKAAQFAVAVDDESVVSLYVNDPSVITKQAPVPQSLLVASPEAL